MAIFAPITDAAPACGTEWAEAEVISPWEVSGGQNPEYRISNGVIYWRGEVKGGSSGTEVIRFPSEFSTTGYTEYLIIEDGSYGVGHFVVSPEGHGFIYDNNGSEPMNLGPAQWPVAKYGECESGKEGKEGPAGPAGATGPEGKEGPPGENGTNGGTELTAFTSTAKAELSEMKQGLETVGWCIIGTMIAAMVAWFTFSILRSRN